jgi:hypothetical protein
VEIPCPVNWVAVQHRLDQVVEEDLRHVEAQYRKVEQVHMRPPKDLAHMAIAGVVLAVVENLDPGSLMDTPAERVAVPYDRMETRKSGSSVVE